MLLVLLGPPFWSAINREREMYLLRKLAVVFVALGSMSVAQADLIEIQPATLANILDRCDGGAATCNPDTTNPDDGGPNVFGDGIADTIQDIDGQRLRVFGRPLDAWRAALEFDLTPVLGSYIESAFLTLTDVDAPATSDEILVEGFAGDGAITLEDSTASNLIGSFITPGPINSVTIDVTEFMQELVLWGELYGGFLLRSAAEIPGSAAYDQPGVDYVFSGSDFAGIGFSGVSPPILSIQVVSVPESVAIDIKPGNDKNCFKQNGKGTIPVAVLGDATFDPTNIDISTLDFSGLSVAVKGNGQVQCEIDDVDSDGFWDLECKFADSENWTGGPDEATLTGELYDGTEFQGTDTICIK